MTANLYTNQERNIWKTWFLMGSFLVLVIAIGWAFGWYYGAPEILWFAVIFAILMNIFSYWYSDKIVIKLTGAKKIEKNDNPELWNIVENLSITAGLPMPKLYVVEDRVPNAFATGRDPEHSAVAVTTGLMDILDRSELEGVIAHELSHIGNRDILVSTVVVVLVGFVAIISDIFLRGALFGGGDRNNRGGLLAIIGIVLAILAPVAATLIKLAVSRKREYLADSSGALLTRYPEGLASALEKISRYSGRMKKAHDATAHLYIANPFGSSASRGIHKMFQTHPPVEDRVRALRGGRD
jgi:heat shock protein HtpX